MEDFLESLDMSNLKDNEKSAWEQHISSITSRSRTSEVYHNKNSSKRKKLND